MNEAFAPMALNIGVTGHRDIPSSDIPSLEIKIERLLLTAKSEYPNCEINILSPLANGADRIAARVGLNLGYPLIVPLPMEESEYKNDFDEASKLEFDSLLAQAKDVFIAPVVEPLQASHQRGFYYRQAGRYIATHSHMLIALWDRNETLYPGGGGTYETILFAYENDTPVHIINTSRTGSTKAIVNKSADNMAQQTTDKCTSYSDNLAMLNTFYDDIVKNRAILEVAAAANKPQFIDAQTESGLSPGAKRLLDTCLYADALCMKYQKLKLLSLRVLSIAGLLFVLTFLLYDELGARLMLFLYAAIIISAFIMYYISLKHRYHEKYIAYRAIAEALRVQFYWCMANINESAYDAYTFMQKDSLGFVKSLLVSLSGDIKAFAPINPNKAKELWVGGQQAYHKKSAVKKAKTIKANAKTSGMLLMLSIALLALIIIMELFFESGLSKTLPLNYLQSALLIPFGETDWRSIFKILLGSFSAGTAFLSNYYGNLSLPQQLFSSRRMNALFENMQITEQDEKALKKALITIGREMMIENAGWYIAQQENTPGLFI